MLDARGMFTTAGLGGCPDDTGRHCLMLAISGNALEEHMVDCINGFDGVGSGLKGTVPPASVNMLGGMSILGAKNVLVAKTFGGFGILLALLAGIGGNMIFDGTCVNIESLTLSLVVCWGKAGKLEGIWGTIVSGTDVTLIDGFTEADVLTAGSTDVTFAELFFLAPWVACMQQGHCQSRVATP